MVNSDEILAVLKKTLPDAHIEVTDLTGTQDHYEVRVASKSFEGLTLIQQHQAVQSPLKEFINDGRLHAISIKTSMP
ncbi:MAG: BolA/IbaG family iron-sulfur metabolism protein [Chlamydiota bacterium]|nr:BolA/IbaG family iron-sulfur metabolism protein [Chlamydiota bacterium]